MRPLLFIFAFFLAFFSLLAQNEEPKKPLHIFTANTPTANTLPLPKGSFGGMLPGASYKTYFPKKISLQTDILVRPAIAGSMDGFGFYFVIESSTNLMYQKKIQDKNNYDLFLLVGGGFSVGFVPVPINGKFGANSMIGIEFFFKKSPLVIQLDIRPGYAVLFNNHYRNPFISFIPDENPWHHFDWSIGVAFRRAFTRK